MKNYYFGICLRGQFLPLLPWFVMLHLASSHSCSRGCFQHHSVITVVAARKSLVESEWRAENTGQQRGILQSFL